MENLVVALFNAQTEMYLKYLAAIFVLYLVQILCYACHAYHVTSTERKVAIFMHIIFVGIAFCVWYSNIIVLESKMSETTGYFVMVISGILPEEATRILMRLMPKSLQHSLSSAYRPPEIGDSVTVYLEVQFNRGRILFQGQKYYAYLSNTKLEPIPYGVEVEVTEIEKTNQAGAAVRYRVRRIHDAPEDEGLNLTRKERFMKFRSKWLF